MKTLIISKKTVAILSRLFFFIFLACFSFSVKAAPTFHFSPSIDYVFYRELSETGETLNTETGYLPGFELSINHYMSEQISFYVQGYYGSSSIQYEGQLQSGLPYDTDSKMTKSSYRFGGNYLGIKKGIGFFLEHNEWDRHIQSRDNIPTLSEYYSWDSIGVNYFMSFGDRQFNIELARLWNAGLSVDLSEQGYGVIPVSMPNGVSAKVSAEQPLSDSYPRWKFGVQIEMDYFPRGETVYSQGIGLTEPENISLQFRLYLSRSLNIN